MRRAVIALVLLFLVLGAFWFVWAATAPQM
jgi:hypothetical protein